MLYREIFRILGRYFLAFAGLLLVPLGVAVYYEFFVDPSDHPQPHATIAFLETICLTLGVAAFFSWLGRRGQGVFYRREGLVVVVAIWVLTPMVAMMPFLFTGTLESPVHAYFEATSGLTTTGASLLHAKQYNLEMKQEVPIRRVVRGEFDTEYVFYGTVEPVRDASGEVLFEGIEAVSKPVLFWRSFLQWIGGLGIVVLFVAVLPALGVGGKVLFHTEMPGPIKESLTPRLIETAILLWKIYLGLSIFGVFLLMVTNPDLPLFDALCLIFSSISTGGFTVRNGSVGAYQNVNTEWVIILFMLVGSINFSLYFYALRGKFFRFNDPELIVYFLVLFTGGCFAAYWIYGTEKILLGAVSEGVYSFREAITHGFFQVISAQTSSGFATSDFDKWPFVVQVMMLILIYLGGMSGSTAGGMKMMRHIMVFRITQNKIELLFRPTTVRPFRIGKREVALEAALTVLCFFVTVIALAVLSTFLLCMTGLDPETALTVVTSTINNSGMGFREAGPTDSYAFLSPFGHVWTSLLMILGRLEFFAVLVILVPAFWKQQE